jgi:hypothetical protein
MQQKMSEIQQELQKLSDYLQSRDPKSIDNNQQKQLIAAKSQRLKKEFAEVLLKLQIRSNTHNQAIPSDDVILRINYYICVDRLLLQF